MSRNVASQSVLKCSLLRDRNWYLRETAKM